MAKKPRSDGVGVSGPVRGLRGGRPVPVQAPRIVKVVVGGSDALLYAASNQGAALQRLSSL